MKNLSRAKQIIAVLVLAVAIAVPIAIAQSTGKHFGHRGGDGMMSGRMFSQLNLTDAQKAQLQQIRQNHSETIKSLRQQIHSQMQGLRPTDPGATFDEAAAAQKLAQVAPLQAKLMGEEFKIHQEMLTVLTPEQKAKLDQMRAQFKEKRAERQAKKSASEL